MSFPFPVFGEPFGWAAAGFVNFSQTYTREKMSGKAFSFLFLSPATVNGATRWKGMATGSFLEALVLREKKLINLLFMELKVRLSRHFSSSSLIS